jgi:hypothetical protein
MILCGLIAKHTELESSFLTAWTPGAQTLDGNEHTRGLRESGVGISVSAGGRKLREKWKCGAISTESLASPSRAGARKDLSRVLS